MDKIYEWVEQRYGQKIDKDIAESLMNQNEFDEATYSKRLVDENVEEADLIALRKICIRTEYIDSPAVSEDETGIDEDDDHLDLSTLTSNNEFGLELMSPDEVISHADWNNTRDKLRDMLISGSGTIPALKIYQKLLTYYNSPRTVCEGFTSLSDVVANLIDHANIMEDEETYEIRNSRLGPKTAGTNQVSPRGFKDNYLQTTLFKSFHLLIEVQKNAMPDLWIRFNERRLTEVINSFISLMARSFNLDQNTVTAFDIISVLSPEGSWCKHWCHGATGKSLLCGILRRKKRFFNGLVDIVVSHVLNRNKKSTKEMWLQEISSEKLRSARFIHAFSMLTYILGCKMGRALFPVLLTNRKRPWTVSDVVCLMLDHVEAAKKDVKFSTAYKKHFLEMGGLLAVAQKETGTPRTARSYR